LVVILILMLVLFYLFAWKPQVEKLDEIGKQRVEEEQKIQAAKNTLIRLEEVRKNVANAEVELIKLANKIPKDPELASLIVEVQNMATDAGIDLLSIKPSEPAPVGEFNEMKVNISGKGSYVAIIDFLRRTEKAHRALKVTNVDVRLNEQEYPDLGLSLTMSAYTVGDGVQPAEPAPRKGK